jgi:hypothetical protein
MTTTTLSESADSLPALCAPGRSPEVPVSADVYGWLVGSSELDVLFYLVHVSPQNLKAKAHFFCALEGRAVQDVSIMPRRHGRTAPPDRSCNMYGTASFEKGQSL